MTGTAFEIARVDSVFSHQFIEFGSGLPARAAARETFPPVSVSTWVR